MGVAVLTGVISIYLSLCLCQTAKADHLSSEPLSWANSAWLGSGFYHVGQEETFHVNTPFVVPLIKSGQLTYQLATAVSMGLRGFRLLTLSPPRELSTLSVVPGLQVTYRYSDRFSIKPFVQTGGGMSFTEAISSVALMSVGVKSLYRLSLWGKTLNWGQRVLFSSATDLSSGEQSQRHDWSILVSSNTGIEIEDVSRYRVGVHDLDVNLYTIYSAFIPKVTDPETFSWTCSVGFHTGRRVQASRSGHVSEEGFRLRGGIYYVFGDERLRGVRINLGFPF